MSIDIGALRKFQDLWGPVLETIPAVIEATAKQDDLARAIAAQNKLLDKAKQDVAAAYEEADKRLVAVNEELESLKSQKVKVVEAITAEQAKSKESADVAMADVKTKLDLAVQKLVQATEKLNGVEAEYATKVVMAQAEHDAALNKMASEIKAMEDRHAKAEKALDSLKAKLG